MRRRFHTYLVVAVALLGGGLASALIVQASGATPTAQQHVGAQASVQNRGRFTKRWWVT